MTSNWCGEQSDSLAMSRSPTPPALIRRHDGQALAGRGRASGEEGAGTHNCAWRTARANRHRPGVPCASPAASRQPSAGPHRINRIRTIIDHRLDHTSFPATPSSIVRDHAAKSVDNSIRQRRTVDALTRPSPCHRSPSASDQWPSPALRLNPATNPPAPAAIPPPPPVAKPRLPRTPPPGRAGAAARRLSRGLSHSTPRRLLLALPLTALVTSHSPRPTNHSPPPPYHSASRTSESRERPPPKTEHIPRRRCHSERSAAEPRNLAFGPCPIPNQGAPPRTGHIPRQSGHIPSKLDTFARNLDTSAPNLDTLARQS